MSKDDFLNLSNWENIFLQLEKYYLPTGEIFLPKYRIIIQLYNFIYPQSYNEIDRCRVLLYVRPH